MNKFESSAFSSTTVSELKESIHAGNSSLIVCTNVYRSLVLSSRMKQHKRNYNSADDMATLRYLIDPYYIYPGNHKTLDLMVNLVSKTDTAELRNAFHRMSTLWIARDSIKLGYSQISRMSRSQILAHLAEICRHDSFSFLVLLKLTTLMV